MQGDMREDLEPAPFHGDVADAPQGAHALWAHCPDGARMRLGVLATTADVTGAPRGSVLLFPGRTEAIEKYGRAAGDFARRGYATICPDWRGQGLSDRFLPDRRTGHVHRFEDYQHDVAALLQAASALCLPRPWHLVAHSMGGAIGLRACRSGLPVASAVFSGPMWGIRLGPLMRAAAWAVASAARPLGLSGRIVPTASEADDILAIPFEDNVLTTDPEMYAWMQAQNRAYPDLALGPPSLGWLYEALRECRALARGTLPRLPALCVVGAREQIVDIDAIRRRMASWPGGRLLIEPGAEHEVMMEAPAIRTRFFDTACAHFDAAAAK
jgi:lysophospholipase